MSFLNREMQRLYGFPIRNIVLDTAVLDRSLFLMKTPLSQRSLVTLESTLESMAVRYKVSIEGLHSSLGDALATAQIFQQMLKEVERCGIHQLKDLVKFATTPPGLCFNQSEAPSL